MTDEEAKKLKTVLAVIAPVPKDAGDWEAFQKHGQSVTDEQAHTEWVRLKVEFAEAVFDAVFGK